MDPYVMGRRKDSWRSLKKSVGEGCELRVLMEIGAYSRILLWRGVWGRSRLHRGVGTHERPLGRE